MSCYSTKYLFLKGIFNTLKKSLKIKIYEKGHENFSFKNYTTTIGKKVRKTITGGIGEKVKPIKKDSKMSQLPMDKLSITPEKLKTAKTI